MSQSPSPAGAARKEDSRRCYTLRLTFSSLLTATIVLVIGIGWAFMLGVMVGRGYNPESKVPQLSRWLPAEELAPAQNKQRTVEDNLPKGGVMKPEDLNYAASLRNKPGQKHPSRDLAEVKPPKPATPAEASAPASQPVKQATPPPKPATPPQHTFDYSFQVATFKDRNTVDALRQRLEGAGYRSRVDKSGKWLKVMVLMRGTEEAAATLQEHLKTMGLGKALQRSKKPVTSRKN